MDHIPYITIISHNGGRVGPKEIDGMIVRPVIAYTLLTDILITGKRLWSEPAQEK